MINSNNEYLGKYQQLEMVGKGMYGTIYRVKSHSDGKDYVAKHIPLEQIQESVAQKQLQIIKKLRHPYIVEYIDSFTSGNQFIIIMEYCKEKDMDHQIKLMKSKNKHFNENLIITWLFQLVLGIQFIHSKKILHRDIKPQNIFIDENLNIKIGDFGISKILSSTGQQCQTMTGTPYYLAPEIIKQQPYTTKADIWSLGCVIYQICTLERPFQSKGGILQLMNIIKTSEIKEITKIYSDDLKKLVIKMMTRDQTKRPNTTQLLKDPVLVDLMIKNSSSISLKKQYSKQIDKPSNLSDSFIKNQTNLVHQQLKRFEKEVQMKMQGLKKKNINSAEIDEQQIELKKKMGEIQKAIGKAFEQLRQKAGSGKEEDKLQGKNMLNNSSLTDSSEMTIIESVVIGQDPSSKKQKSSMKYSGHLASESKTNQSQKKSINLQYSSIMSAQSMVLDQSSQLEKSQSLQLQSNIQHSKLDESESFDKTLQSQYQKTQKSNTLTKQTLDKLEFLQKALSRNPDSVLNDSLLSFTLTMSEEDIRRSMRAAAKLNSMNALSIRVKNQLNSHESIDLDLTKKSLQTSGKMDKAFMKKPNKFENNFEGISKSQSKEQAQEYYDQDFQDYEQYQEQNQDGEQIECSVMVSIKDKRRQELDTIKSFYQQTLQQINNQSEMNEPMTKTQKVKDKYPLDMSQIKEQIGEAGSIVSKKNNSSNNSSFGV